MTNNKKVLYFEGAGWEDTHRNDLSNCRIRTAFTNNEGKQIYLELSSAPIYKDKEVERYWLHIDYVFYITGDKDDCNNSKIFYDRQSLKDNYDYSTEDITRWINKNLNCNFDTVEVLPIYEGYRVHGDKGSYNIIDNHKVDIERSYKRKEAYNKIDKEYREKFNSKYSVISMYEMKDDTITIRCYASDNAIKQAGLTERLKTITI